MPTDKKPQTGAPVAAFPTPAPQPGMTVAQEAGLPENWEPISSAPINPAGGPPAPAGMGSYFSGSIPQNLQLQPDLVSTEYQGNRIPNVRLMPVGPAGNPGVVAAASSVITEMLGNLTLVMPKEYKVQNGVTTIVTWAPELSETALMGPPLVSTTTFNTPYFNATVGGQSFTGASGTITFAYTLNPWNGSTVYAPGALIVDSNNNVQRCTTGGTSTPVTHPNWATAVGATTQDNTVTWTCVKYIITAGDTIFFTASIDPSASGATVGPASISVATDNAGNMYAALQGFQQYTNAGARHQTVSGWYAKAQQNVTYGTNLTISITVTGGHSDSSTLITSALFSNIGTVGTGTFTQVNGVMAWSSGTLTLLSEQILFAYSAAEVTIQLAAGSPFTPAFASGGANSPELAYYFPNAPANYSDGWTSAFSTNAASAMVYFSASSQTVVSSPASGIPGFRYIQNWDLSHAIFGASGPSHAPGAVPDPGLFANVTEFLRSDATWAVPPVFGASGPSHMVGYVPDPGNVAGTSRFLREDATWDAPPGGLGTFTNTSVNFENLQSAVPLLEDTTAKVTVADTSITTSSTILATITGGGDHPDSDEAAAEGLTVSVGNIVNGVSYDVTVAAPNGSWGIWHIFVAHS